MSRISKLDPSISVANKTLDRQHLTVLNLSQLTLSLGIADRKENFKKFNKNLYEFHLRILDHFYTEEEILARHHFQNIAEHIAEHNQYIERLSYLFFDTSNGVIDQPRLKYCLSDWLSRHLLESDMQYGELLRKD
jgi:hemerythrin-like metal-binding protein